MKILANFAADLNLIGILFLHRAGFENISKYPACLSVYAHQFIFPLVFVGLFSAYLLKKHWSTVVENVNGVNNWGRKIHLNGPEKDQISQVEQPSQGKYFWCTLSIISCTKYSYQLNLHILIVHAVL